MSGVFPVAIVDGDLAIREVGLDDIAAVATLGEHVAREGLGPADWVGDALDSAERRPRTRYSLAVERAGETVALTSLVVEAPESRAEIGYAVVPAHRRDGIATATVAVMVRFAFDVLELRRVFALTVVDNVGSVAVLERNGFRREGRLRGHDPGGADSYFYGLLATDT